MSDISAPQFKNETAAIAHLEASRWPGGVNCPHCGSVNVHRMAGKTQAGYFQCNDCRDKFTARTGTVMERSHIPVHKWLLAIHLLSASKKGMSAHQLHRMLGVTYKSAWFLSHRIREAMTGNDKTPMGSAGNPVQADETYYGQTSKRAKGYRPDHVNKSRVVALVEPMTGRARAFHVSSNSAENVTEILRKNVLRRAALVTDESGIYTKVGREYSEHHTVYHKADEYVSPEGYTTNNVENFFGIFKKGMVGVYHFCGEQHLQRYLDEFCFRYSNRSGLGVNDAARAARALKGIEGKRLTYRRPN